MMNTDNQQDSNCGNIFGLLEVPDKLDYIWGFLKLSLREFVIPDHTYHYLAYKESMQTMN